MAVSSVTTRNLAGTGCTGIGQRKEVCTTSQDGHQSYRNRCQHHFLCCTLMVSVNTLKAERSLASGLVSSPKTRPHPDQLHRSPTALPAGHHEMSKSSCSGQRPPATNHARDRKPLGWPRMRSSDLNLQGVAV